MALVARLHRLFRGPVTIFTTNGPLVKQLQSIHVVRCNGEAAWRFLGLSLAGYNVLISLALAGIARSA